ncbi:DUF4189 domain-containing protein [Nocardia sp. NPDC056000]|uniref:DUF4189 domain-containing protein n=1 Tax=Nocardia sp. NPDC056000 TaxID=3345674 RepID=UPI0035D75D18
MSMSGKAAAFAAAGVAFLSAGAPLAGASGSLHGSIAVDTKINGNPRASWGATWNYPNQSAAENAALRECGGGSCRVIISWSDGCASVVGSDGETTVAGGVGATPAEAEQNAIANIKIEDPILFTPQPATGSVAGTPGMTPHVIVTKCTG